MANNFTASAMGCKIPTKETLLGPFRACLRPKIFRSMRVKKATLISTQTTAQIIEINLKIMSLNLYDFSVTLFLSYDYQLG